MSKYNKNDYKNIIIRTIIIIPLLPIILLTICILLLLVLLTIPFKINILERLENWITKLQNKQKQNKHEHSEYHYRNNRHEHREYHLPKQKKSKKILGSDYYFYGNQKDIKKSKKNLTKL